jgi:hypothetical protein
MCVYQYNMTGVTYAAKDITRIVLKSMTNQGKKIVDIIRGDRPIARQYTKKVWNKIYDLMK